MKLAFPLVLISIITTGLLALPDTAAGSGVDAGLSGKVPFGARAVGMGGSYLAVADDALAIFWNPAGLGFPTKCSLQLEGESRAMGRQTLGLVALVPLVDKSRISVKERIQSERSEEKKKTDKILDDVIGNIDAFMDGQTDPSAMAESVDEASRKQLAETRIRKAEAEQAAKAKEREEEKSVAPPLKQHNLAFGLLTQIDSGITAADATGNRTGDFNAYANGLYIGWGFEIDNNLHLGMTLKGHNSILNSAPVAGADAWSWGIGEEIGARYVLFDYVSIGFALVDPLGLTGWNSGGQQYLSTVAPGMRLGVAFTTRRYDQPDQDFWLNLGVGFQQDLLSNDFTAFIGGEGSFRLGDKNAFLKRAAMRAGFLHGRLSLGGGVTLPFTDLTYAWRRDDLEMDGTHSIALAFGF